MHVGYCTCFFRLTSSEFSDSLDRKPSSSNLSRLDILNPIYLAKAISIIIIFQFVWHGSIFSILLQGPSASSSSSSNVYGMARYSQSYSPCQSHQHHHPHPSCNLYGMAGFSLPCQSHQQSVWETGCQGGRLHNHLKVQDNVSKTLWNPIIITITSKSKTMSTKHFEIHSSLHWMIGCNSGQFLFWSAPEIVCQQLPPHKWQCFSWCAPPFVCKSFISISIGLSFESSFDI